MSVLGDDPFRFCVYCNTDCYADEPDHAEDCPSLTGVFPVRDGELYELGNPCDECGHRNASGFRCSRCDQPFVAGDFYHHIQIGDANGIPVYGSVCAGCAAHDELVEAA